MPTIISESKPQIAETSEYNVIANWLSIRPSAIHGVLSKKSLKKWLRRKEVVVKEPRQSNKTTL
jgi:hypothetical protein